MSSSSEDEQADARATEVRGACGPGLALHSLECIACAGLECVCVCVRLRSPRACAASADFPRGRRLVYVSETRQAADPAFQRQLAGLVLGGVLLTCCARVSVRKQEPGSTEATQGGEREGDGESPPKAAESDGRPTAGGKSISAISGSGAGGEGKTGISDDSEEGEEGATPSAAASIKKKVVDDESEEEEAEGVGSAAEADSKAGGKTGLSSDSEGEDDEPRKQGGGSAAHEDGDTEMADATHKDVFGDSDSDDEGLGDSSNKHKGQKVLLNMETGQLERGPVEDAPEHAIQDSHVGRDRRAVPKDTLKFSIPELPRPPKGARLIYANPPKRHLSVDHAPFSTVDQEAKRIASQRALDRFYESASSMRWRFKAAEGESAEAWEKRGKESNARFVEWSDGSVTLHVGAEVLQVKHEGLERNDHHLYVAHHAAKFIQDDGDTGPGVPIIEGHGILEAR